MMTGAREFFFISTKNFLLLLKLTSFTTLGKRATRRTRLAYVSLVTVDPSIVPICLNGHSGLFFYFSVFGSKHFYRILTVDLSGIWTWIVGVKASMLTATTTTASIVTDD